MSQDFIVIPNSNKKLYDGSIVILERLPGTKWIVHNGYYSYNGRRANGWYLASLPSGTNMPLCQSDLYMIRIVDDVPGPEPSPCPCPPGPGPGPCPPGPEPGPHPGPCPPGPDYYPFTRWDKDHIMKSMITVPSLADRDLLSSTYLPDGKVVRVNDYQGKVEYFEWSAETQTWVLLNFGDRVALKSEVADEYATKDEVSDIDDEVQDNSTHLGWNELPDPEEDDDDSDDDSEPGWNELPDPDEE